MKKLPLVMIVLLVLATIVVALAQTAPKMAIRLGFLQTPLDANSQPIVNASEVQSSLFTGSGLGLFDVQPGAVPLTNIAQLVETDPSGSSIFHFELEDIVTEDGEELWSFDGATDGKVESTVIRVGDLDQDFFDVSERHSPDQWIRLNPNILGGSNARLYRIGTEPVSLSFDATISTDASLGVHFRIAATDSFVLASPTSALDGQRVVWEIASNGSYTMGLGSKFTLSSIPITHLGINYFVAVYNALTDRWSVVGYASDTTLSGGGDVGGDAIWGAIAGDIANQTDLQTALGGKANTVHVHSSSELQAALGQVYQATNAALSKITENSGLPLWDGAAWPGGGGIVEGSMLDRIDSEPVAIVFGSTISTDASLGSLFYFTASGDFTLAAPSNPLVGQRVVWLITQDSTGGRQITWGAGFTYKGKVPVPFSLNPNSGEMTWIVAVWTSAIWEVVGVTTDTAISTAWNDITDIPANLTAWSAIAPATKQDASANLTAWSGLATSAKQDASANLTSWSAIAPSAKQDASANLTAWSGLAPATKKDAYAQTTLGSSGSITIDLLGSDYQLISATGDIALTASNQGATRGAVVIIDANGANRNLSIPSTWFRRGVDAVVTNGTVAVISLYSYGSTDATVIASGSAFVK
jgi:hypothetical protein